MKATGMDILAIERPVDRLSMISGRERRGLSPRASQRAPGLIRKTAACGRGTAE